MAIDWAATGAMLTGIGTLASAASIAVAAIVGNKKVNDFTEQRRSERQLEFAESALAVTYRLESVLDAIRSPFSSGGELDLSRKELEDLDWFKAESKQKQDRWVQSNVFIQRIRRFEKDFDEALTLLPFVKAYFGAEVEEALAQLLKARNLVRINAEEYAEDSGSDPEFTKDIRAHIWGSFSSKRPDPIRDLVRPAVELLEKKLGPIIREEIKSGRKPEGVALKNG